MNLRRREGIYNVFITQKLKIDRKWHRVIFELLESRDSSGKIHHYDKIKTAARIADFKFKDLSQLGTEPPLKSQMFSKIVTHNLSKKQRAIQNSRSLTSEEKEQISEFWLSPSISRVSPHETLVVKRRSHENPTMSIPVYYRQCSIKEAFEKFQLFNPQVNCCRTTFYKFKPKNVKKR